MIPALLFVLGVLGYAVFEGFRLSLYQIDMYTIDEPFVGLRNYMELFRNPTFQNSLVRSLIFVGNTLFFGTLLSLAYALVLYRVTRFRSFFRGVSIMPWMVSGVAAAVMFRFLFSGTAGFIPLFLNSFGIRMSWLGHPSRAMFVIILTNIWFITPFSILLILSGLQTIDPELYDSASLDGASSPQIFRHITAPLIKPQIGISLLWLSFASFNMFDIVLPMTGGGPSRSTELLAVYLFRVAFEQVNISMGAAIMIILLLINVLVSGIILKLFRV